MKQIFLIPTSALVAVCALSSCQKEEMSCTEIVNELTAVLQKVTDYDSAEAAAPRVEALMKRWQRAARRPIALNNTALLRSVSATPGSPEKDYVEALDALAEQVARVMASYPVVAYDGEIDEERLKRAVGTKGVVKRAGAAAEVKKGEEYIATYKAKNTDFDGDANNTVCSFEACYGSANLKNALDLRETPVTGVLEFDGDDAVIATPEYQEPAGGAEPAGDAAATEGDSADASEEGDAAGDDSAADDSASDDSAADDSASDDSSDDLGLDVGEPADEEPADDSSDEEPADEEPADEEPADEEPADEDASDEDSSGDDLDSDGGVDMDFGGLDLD